MFYFFDFLPAILDTHWTHFVLICSIQRYLASQRTLIKAKFSDQGYLTTTACKCMYWDNSDLCWSTDGTYSKASRYTASSCMDLNNVRFWIGSKKFWNAWIYIVRTFRCTRFLYELFSLVYDFIWTIFFSLCDKSHSPETIDLRK